MQAVLCNFVVECKQCMGASWCRIRVCIQMFKIVALGEGRRGGEQGVSKQCDKITDCGKEERIKGKWLKEMCSSAPFACSPRLGSKVFLVFLAWLLSLGARWLLQSALGLAAGPP
jgi:hypothetical protein